MRSTSHAIVVCSVSVGPVSYNCSLQKHSIFSRCR